MKEFRPSFVPLFVTVDAIGVLPAFHSLSQGKEPRQVRRAIFYCLSIATPLTLALLALGHRRLRSLFHRMQPRGKTHANHHPHRRRH